MLKHFFNRIQCQSIRSTATIQNHLPQCTSISLLQSCTVNNPYISSLLGSIRFATKKAGGSSKNTKDSAGRRLGLKISGGAKGVFINNNNNL